MDIDRQTSNVLKGIAIILIVISHVIWSMPSFIRSGYEAVSVLMGPAQIGMLTFLFLSGYGICRSYGLSGIDARKYLWRRFRRVVVPYWAVLTLYIVAILIFLPSYFSDKAMQLAILLNYCLIVFSPYDIIGVGWFVTYIIMWYLAYLLVSKLQLKEGWKIAAMLAGVPVLVYFGSGSFAGLIRPFAPGLNVNVLYESRTFYLPYAFAFPLGVLASRWGGWRLKIGCAPLSKVGEYSYYIYLLHIGLLCSLAIFGCNDFCFNWTQGTVFNYLTEAQQQTAAGNYSIALALADKAIALNTVYGRSYNVRGAVKFTLGDYAGAIADYGKAMELEPSFAGAYWNRALVKSKLGDYAGAIADYDKAIGLNPNDAEYYAARGISHANLGNYTGAVADFDRAIALDPKYVEAYAKRGALKTMQGDYNGGIADLDKALELEPGIAEAYYNRGSAKHMLEDFEGAKADVDRAHAIDPRYPDYESAVNQSLKQ